MKTKETNKTTMSKIKINIWILATLLALLTACRDEADDVIQPGILEGKDTLTEQFDIIWSGINQNYVFWEIDPTDWDAVYTQYRPRFEELDKKDTVPTADLQKLYEEVCGTLIDHHMNIRLKNLKPAPGDQTDIVSVHPGAMEVLQREDFFLDIPREGFQVYRDKLKAAGRITNDYEFVNNNPEANFDHLFTYVIDNDILYLRFSSFAIIEQISKANNPENTEAREATEVYGEYMNQLVFNQEIKGVIVDVRNNGGGILWDMFTVLGPLLKEDIHVLDTKTKIGLGRLDYGEWNPFNAQVTTQRQVGEMLDWDGKLPETDCIGDRKLVLLTDNWSVSMSEMTAAAVKQLPYATVIGQRTFGGLGPLTTKTHTSFSGQFGDRNLENTSYFVYTSTWMSRTHDGEQLEGIGITPDIPVKQDFERFTKQHIDDQLEYAINFLHGKK